MFSPGLLFTVILWNFAFLQLAILSTNLGVFSAVKECFGDLYVMRGVWKREGVLFLGLDSETL